MLAVEAPSEGDIRARMDGDPWAPMGLLGIGEILPWTIWLDGRHRSRLRG
jgi:hypothetical protein